MEKNDDNSINQNKKQFSKLLFIQKLNCYKSQKNRINKQISQYFLKPEIYFHQKPLIVVNKKIKIRKLTPINLLKQNMSLQSEATKSTKNKAKILSSLNNIKNSYNENEKENERNSKRLIKHSEIIDNDKLKMIFNSFKKSKHIRIKNDILTNITNNEKKELHSEQNNIKKIDSELCDKNIPRQLSIDLDFQKRMLNKRTKLEKKSRQMSKYLSNKLHNSENNLLFNSVHIYRYKKQILEDDSIKNKTNMNSNKQSCLLNWISSLRRPKNYSGKYVTYINVGANSNTPLWSTIIERYPNIKEISVKSGVNLKNKDYSYFINNKKLKHDKEENIKNLENLDKLSVEGKKLYNWEFNREMDSNNNKILHKSFVDNGKIIMYKDVNNIFGYETIYKNYFGRNKRSFYNRILLNSQSMKNLRKNEL